MAAAVLGGGVVVLPAVAGSETGPAIEAFNSGLYYHYWRPAQASIAPGGSVALSNPTAVNHGVEWAGGPATPACTSGVPVGSGAAASGKEWSGSCTFSQPGTYTFYCTVHGKEMTATVVVSAAATTTTTPPPSYPPTTAPPPPVQAGAEPAPGAGSPLAGGAAAVSLAARQRGTSVHGSVAVSQAGAGGRLQVELLARGASLATAHHARAVRVGRLVRSSLHAGRVPFSVALNARARRGLRTHRRLALTAKIVLTPATGAAVGVTRSIVLRP
jgi:plastocyanin